MKTLTRNSFANATNGKPKEERFVVKNQLCEYEKSSPSTGEDRSEGALNFMGQVTGYQKAAVY
jgi:hypothetical protein